MPRVPSPIQVPSNQVRDSQVELFYALNIRQSKVSTTADILAAATGPDVHRSSTRRNSRSPSLETSITAKSNQRLPGKSPGDKRYFADITDTPGY